MIKEDSREHRRELYASTWGEISASFYAALIAFAMANYTGGDRGTAEDLVQDTICRVLYYAPNPSKITSHLNYLKRALKHLWMDNWQKSKGVRMQSIDDDDEEKQETLLNELPKIHPDAERMLENEEYKKKLRIVMHNLEPFEKDVLKLFLKGYDCDELAEMLGADVYRVKYELNKVRAKVRYRLNGQSKMNGR